MALYRNEDDQFLQFVENRLNNMDPIDPGQKPVNPFSSRSQLARTPKKLRSPQKWNPASMQTRKMRREQEARKSTCVVENENYENMSEESHMS